MNIFSPIYSADLSDLLVRYIKTEKLDLFKMARDFPGRPYITQAYCVYKFVDFATDFVKASPFKP